MDCEYFRKYVKHVGISMIQCTDSKHKKYLTMQAEWNKAYREIEDEFKYETEEEKREDIDRLMRK
jgi:hypothetical protein